MLCLEMAIWQVAVASELELWHASCAGSVTRTPIHASPQVSGLAVGSSNAQLASASWDGTLRLWDCTQLLAPAGQLVGHRGAVHAVAWEPSGSGSMVVSAGQVGRWADVCMKTFSPGLAVNGPACQRHAACAAPDGAAERASHCFRWCPHMRPQRPTPPCPALP